MKKVIGILFLFSLFLFPSQLFSQEICNNGIDDDADLLIDLNDTADCACSGISGGGGGPIPSLIPNPSFEAMNCCPTSYSQVNCATDWIQASTPTSDYMNTCGIVFQAATAAGLQPFPDGNGIIGTIFSPGWQEAVGSCLISPMLAGTSYTIQFDIASTPIDGNGNQCNGGVIDFGPIDITLFGSPNCNELPFSGVGCPIGYSGWDVLGVVNYSPVSSWGVVSITFTPSVNINAIVIGSPCTLPADYQAPPSGCYPYFYYDNLIMNNSGLFNGMSIDPSGGLCTNDLILEADLDTTGGTWQWYDEGVAIIGQTDSILNVSTNGSGGGNYSAVYFIGTECIQGDYLVTNPDYPVASFTNTTDCLGSTTDFTNTSTIASGSITNNDWDFDDGNNSTTASPSNTFASAGNYQVQLIVTSNQGCKDTILQSVTVNPNPTADFTFTGVCNGEITPFTDNSSAPAPLTISSWNWNINGSPYATQNPSVTFPSSGVYSAQLIVTNSAGCDDTITQTVTVNPNPTAAFTHVFHCLGSTTLFSDNSSVSNPQSINQWQWDIDGNTVTTQNGSYVFPNDTTYPVTLTVTTNLGCTDNVTLPVTILQVPDADFSYISNCDGNPIQFVDETSITAPDSIATYTWIINGDTITSSDPLYPFQIEQTYTATLIVVAQNGCTDTIAKNVIQCTDITIPNIFTPNGDGSNEFFYIEGLFGENNHLLVFNRWGQLLFEDENYANGWNAAGVSDGTYYYILHSNLDQIHTGYVTILR